MTITEKYGFKVKPTDGTSDVVLAYVLQHWAANHLPLDLPPSATHWAGVVRTDEEGVERCYAVFGWRKNPQAIEITDFYIYPSRWGVLAGHAAMERIKLDADRTNTCVQTVTPAHNTTMISAYKKYFGVDEPVMLVYQYTPARMEASAEAVTEDEECQQPSQPPLSVAV